MGRGDGELSDAETLILPRGGVPSRRMPAPPAELPTEPAEAETRYRFRALLHGGLFDGLVAELSELAEEVEIRSLDYHRPVVLRGDPIGPAASSGACVYGRVGPVGSDLPVYVPVRK